MGLFDWLKSDQPESEAPPAPAGPATPEQIVASLGRVEQMAVDGKVPPPVLSRVYRVTRRLRETLPRMANAGLDSMEQYSLMATATDYLPEALSGYLRLPRDWADSRPIEGAKTSLLLLVDQLDLLGSTVDKMYDAVLQKDAQALIAHGRFLQERFGQAPTEPPAPPAPPVTRPAPVGPSNPLDLEV